MYMCFSFEVSIGTFIVSWSIGLYLLTLKLSKRQKQNVIFLLIFSSIQLLDAILWFINMKKNTINYVITSFMIPFVLFAQVVYNLLVINKLNNVYTYILLGITALVVSSYNGYTSPSTNAFSSPNWGDHNGENMINKYITMFMFCLLITYNRIGFNGEKLVSLLLILASLIISFLFTGGNGSLWCAIANVFSLYYLYEYGFKKQI